MKRDREAWQVSEAEFPSEAPISDQLAFLLRYAILAPSSHNTQPWKFRVDANRVAVFVDPDRWLRVADADQRELHVSVGCALENLVIAARRFGFAPVSDDAFDPARTDLIAAVRLVPGYTPTELELSLFGAITKRHTNRKSYEQRAIPPVHIAQLSASVADGTVEAAITADREVLQAIDALTVRADLLQFADPSWRSELGTWLRAGAFGQPWLVAKLAAIAVTHLNMGKSTAKRDHEILMSAAAFGAVTTRTNDRHAQVNAGRAFERLWLAAETHGIRVHPMNQILQVPEIQAEAIKVMKLEGVFPQVSFRLGYSGAEAELSPRRPLAEVVISDR